MALLIGKAANLLIYFYYATLCLEDIHITCTGNLTFPIHVFI